MADANFECKQGVDLIQSDYEMQDDDSQLIDLHGLSDRINDPLEFNDFNYRTEPMHKS